MDMNAGFFAGLEADLERIHATLDQRDQRMEEEESIRGAIDALPGFPYEGGKKNAWLIISFCKAGKVNDFLAHPPVATDPNVIPLFVLKTVYKAALALDPVHPFIKSESVRLQTAVRNLLSSTSEEFSDEESGQAADHVNRLFILFDAIGASVKGVAAGVATALYRKFGRIPKPLWEKYRNEILSRERTSAQAGPYQRPADEPADVAKRDKSRQAHQPGPGRNGDDQEGKRPKAPARQVRGQGSARSGHDASATNGNGNTELTKEEEQALLASLRGTPTVPIGELVQQ